MDSFSYVWTTAIIFPPVLINLPFIDFRKLLSHLHWLPINSRVVVLRLYMAKQHAIVLLNPLDPQ